MRGYQILPDARAVDRYCQSFALRAVFKTKVADHHHSNPGGAKAWKDAGAEPAPLTARIFFLLAEKSGPTSKCCGRCRGFCKLAASHGSNSKSRCEARLWPSCANVKTGFFPSVDGKFKRGFWPFAMARQIEVFSQCN
jgi:hypothetical protein